MKTGKIFLAIALMVFASLAAASANPDISNIPNIILEKNSGGGSQILDLRDYATGQPYSTRQLFYSIQSQTDPHLADCFIENDHFLTCNAVQKDTIGTNTIVVKVTNPIGLIGTGSFNVNVTEKAKAEEIIFIAPRNSVVLEISQSINVELVAENNTDNRECFETKTVIDTDDRHEIEAKILPESFCLAGGERTNFTMTISTDGSTRNASYDIAAKLISDSKTITEHIRAKVTDNEDPVNIERIGDYYVCANPYEQQIKISLENNSGRTQNIHLGAENDILLPSFEFSNTTLRSNESEEMDLTINTNQTTSPGEQTIKVFATSKSYYVEREIKINLVECESDIFEISVNPEKADLSKGQSKEFKIKITNNSDNAQEIFLSSDGKLENTLSAYKVNVRANSTELVTLKIKASESASQGSYDIKVTAENSEKTASKTIKIEVGKKHSIELLVQNNDFEARQCSASRGQTFEVTLVNSGDYSENVKLSLGNVDESIQAVLTEKQFEIAKGGQKKFFVFIAPSYSATLGNYTVRLSARTSNVEVSENLRFRVVQAAADVQRNVLQILSYPQEITLQAGEEKTLLFTIKNPTGSEMQNIVLRLYGADNAITAFPVSFATLGAGETKTISRTIAAFENAQNKTYNATLEVHADGYASAKNIAIIIAQSDQNESDNGVVSGLFVLFGNKGMQAIAIILIALLVIFALVAVAVRSGKSDEVSYYTGT